MDSWLTDLPDAPARVLVLRGLPASGKSTFARELVARRPAGTTVRLNNDDLSVMLFGQLSFPQGGAKHVSGLFARLRASMLEQALATPQVRLVIVDNTNLSERTVRDLETITLAAGAQFVVDDRFLDVPMEECIARDRGRAAPVGEKVIRRMAAQASNVTAWVPRRSPLDGVTAYHNDPALPSTVIVDIDGTLAVMDGRSPYQWDRVSEDRPNTAVVSLVQALIASGQHVTVMSGRDGICRADTHAWLDAHVAPGLPLHMRPAGDTRRDDVIKWELFREHVADRFHVRFVLDDRDQVVHLWRRILGVPTFQVADGNF